MTHEQAYQWLHGDRVEYSMCRSAAEAMEAEINRLAAALQAVADLHPAHDSKEGFNEWGEADCFNQAQALARKALGIVA